MELDVVLKERKKETIIINDITTQTSLVKIEVVDETCDKSQTDQNQYNIQHERNSSMVYFPLKTEPADDDACCKSSLYADHYIKDELVIGPTVLQNQNGVLENPPETENSLNQCQCSETSLNELPNVEKKESQTLRKRHYNKKSVSADIPSLQPERSKKQITESRKKIIRMKKKNECGNKHIIASKMKHRVAQDTTDTGKNRRRLYKCVVAGCQKAYYWRTNLFAHKQTHTDTTDTGKNRRRLYKCDVAGCQKAYYWRTNLFAHKQTHTGVKPYICKWEGCGSRFAGSTEFIRHTAKHSGRREFACAPCQLQFSRSDTLSKHMKSQRHNMISEKPLICNWEGCGSRFVSLHEFLRHKRKHNGERPFACAPCQLQFKREDHLRLHKKSQKHKLKEIKN